MSAIRKLSPSVQVVATTNDNYLSPPAANDNFAGRLFSSRTAALPTLHSFRSVGSLARAYLRAGGHYGLLYQLAGEAVFYTPLTPQYWARHAGTPMFGGMNLYRSWGVKPTPGLWGYVWAGPTAHGHLHEPVTTTQAKLYDATHTRIDRIHVVNPDPEFGPTWNKVDGVEEYIRSTARPNTEVAILFPPLSNPVRPQDTPLRWVDPQIMPPQYWPKPELPLAPAAPRVPQRPDFPEGVPSRLPRPRWANVRSRILMRYQADRPATRYRVIQRDNPKNRGRDNSPYRNKKAAVPLVVARAILSSATEGMDFIGAVYDSIPEQYKTKTVLYRGNRRILIDTLNPYEKALAIWQNWNKIDMNTLIGNLAYEQLVDTVFGTLGSAIGKQYRAGVEAGLVVDRPFGWQAGEWEPLPQANSKINVTRHTDAGPYDKKYRVD